MVEIEPTTAILRIGDGDPQDPYRKFSATCTLVYESREVVWVKALVGQLTKQQLRELLAWFLAHGVKTVKATRAPGHRLPGFVEVDGHLQLELASMRERALAET